MTSLPTQNSKLSLEGKSRSKEKIKSGVIGGSVIRVKPGKHMDHQRNLFSNESIADK